jgi:hypothetical protein
MTDIQGRDYWAISSEIIFHHHFFFIGPQFKNRCRDLHWAFAVSSGEFALIFFLGYFSELNCIR